MKKIAKFSLLVLLIAICAVTVVACDKSQNKLTIGIDDNNLPQTVFVKGNDLNLSAGKLTVTQGKKKSEIALDADGVEVSGYNKDTVGAQTLTISYSGASTTLAINVVERITPSNHVSEYIAGQSFDNAGLLKITKDNGESFTVYLRDEKVTVSGFDSYTVGTQTVGVKYKDGNIEFNGSFPVIVYSADSIRFTAPTNRNYKSHDTEIDTAGGYFTVSYGSLTKNVLLDKTKITGFDPSAVSEENPSVRQTIHIAYLDNDYTFEINLVLSNVTRIKKVAESLELNWNWGNIPSFTDEQGELAINTLKRYYSLSEEDTALITNDEILAIVRPAVVYGEKVWTAEVEKYTTLFDVSNNILTLNCEDLEETKAGFEEISALDKNNHVLFLYGDLLGNAIYDFGRRSLYGQVSIGQYLSSITTGDDVIEAINKINLMLQMHEALKAIPEDWQVSDLFLPAYAEKIEEAHSLVVQLGEITQPLYERMVFDNVSAWREKDDYFEILYRYYFALYTSDNKAEQEKGSDGIGDMIDICMPGILETFYLQYIGTLIEQYSIVYSDTTFPSNLDTIGFVMSYRTLVNLMNEIIEIDDEMIKTLFIESELSNLVFDFQTSDYGLHQLFGGAYDDPAFNALWDEYIDVVKTLLKYNDSNSDSDSDADDDDALLSFAEANGEMIKKLLGDFINLTPELQTSFLASVNAYRIASIDPESDYETGRIPIFTMLIIAYYMDVLPENLLINGNNNGIVSELLDAMSLYMQRYEVVDSARPTYFYYLEQFINSMENVQTMYGQLSGADKEVFDNHVGFFYERYLEIYNMYDVNGKFKEQEFDEQEKWEEQLKTLETMYQSLSSLIQVVTLSDYTKYPVFISAYEATAELYHYLMTEAPKEVQDIILYSKTDIFSDMTASLESYYYQLRAWQISFLSDYPVGDEYSMMIWDEYNASALGKYMASLFSFYTGAIANDNRLTLEQVKSAMKGFRDLTETEKSLFIKMDGDGEYIYFKALRTFFAKQFVGLNGALEISNALVDLEINWINTLTNDEFVEAWEGIATKYEALSGEEKTKFDENLQEVYEYYKGIYDGIKADEVSQ